jgi:hypothetical protein
VRCRPALVKRFFAVQVARPWLRKHLAWRSKRTGRGDVAAASPGRTEVRPSAVAAVYDRRGQLVRRGTNPSDWRRIAPPSQDRNLAAPIFSIGRNTFRLEQDASTVVKDSSTKHIQ